ncbi:MAG TPA: Wzz/FepE/Etk N-terminal domain-containing protein, partial [Burkholderiales bacterium]|nr:Wzz/FepE/Etk N-terminal domain-containing protein [Burkholderiales bacterium]
MPDQAAIERADEKSTSGSGELSLLDLPVLLVKNKRIVLGVPLAAAVVSAIVGLLLPIYYTGTARILPPQQSASAATALLNQLGSTLGGLTAAATNALAIRNPN